MIEISMTKFFRDKTGNRQINKLRFSPIITSILFGIIGLLMLALSQAATTNILISNELGIASGTHLVDSDSSGDSFVRFTQNTKPAVNYALGFTENSQTKLFFSLPNTVVVNSVELLKEGAVINSLEGPTINTARVGNQVGVSAGLEILNLSKNNTNPQNEVKATYDLINDTGFGYTRMPVLWPSIEKSRVVNGVTEYYYDWTAIDRAVFIARSHDLKIIAELAYTPDRLKLRAECEFGHCPPTDLNQYANFAEAAVDRYKDHIKVWEIWNEPNLQSFWQERDLSYLFNGVLQEHYCPSAKTFTNLLKATYPRIKTKDPSATVLTGGLGNQGGCDISARSYLKMIYGYGGRGYFDAVGIHGYSSFRSPLTEQTWNLYPQVGELQRIMVDNGDSKKPVWQTEASYANSCNSGSNCFDAQGLCQTAWDDPNNPCFQEQHQALMLINATYNWFRWENVGPYNIYKVRDDWGDDGVLDPNNLHENFGITKYPYDSSNNSLQTKYVVPILKNVLNQYVIVDPAPNLNTPTNYQIKITLSDGSVRYSSNYNFTAIPFDAYLNLPIDPEYPCLYATPANPDPENPSTGCYVRQ
jgi:hypothetical protein